MKRKSFLIFLVPLIFLLMGWSSPKLDCNYNHVVRYVTVECLPVDFSSGVNGMVFPPPSTCATTNPLYNWGLTANQCRDPWGAGAEDQLEYIAYAVGSNGNSANCNFQERQILRNANRLNHYACYSTNTCKRISAGAWQIKYPLGSSYRWNLGYAIGCRQFSTSPTSYTNIKSYGESMNMLVPANCEPMGAWEYNLLEVDDWVGSHSCPTCRF